VDCINTKKIWLIAMVFGIFASVLLFLKVTESQKPSIQQEKPLVIEHKEKKEEAKAEVEIVSKMIPDNYSDHRRSRDSGIRNPGFIC
jgi:hypothetical protein